MEVMPAHRLLEWGKGTVRNLALNISKRRRRQSEINRIHIILIGIYWRLVAAFLRRVLNVTFHLLA